VVVESTTFVLIGTEPTAGFTVIRDEVSRMYSEILLPTDSSSDTDEAVEHAIAAARRDDATLHVLHVVDAEAYGSYSGDEYVHEFEGLEHALEEAGEKAVEAVVERAREAGVDVEAVFRNGVPYEEILAYAEDADVDVIFVGSKRRSGDYRRLLGSVADRVAQLADRPVTIVKTNPDQ
jgi:nucleotide-binding universal stress UspA family protein